MAKKGRKTTSKAVQPLDYYQIRRAASSVGMPASMITTLSKGDKNAIKLERRRRNLAKKHERAHQAAAARAKRDIDQLGAYSHANLAKTADRQLANIARTVAKEWDRQKRAEITKASQTAFHPSPIERPTKRERMYAQRPDITDAMIAAEPVAKRRKLLRQQQRRINMAKAHINEWNRIQAMPKQTVLERRMSEIEGTTGESYERSGVTASKLTDLLTMENTLGDRAYIEAQLRSGHREEVIRDIHDAAKVLGLRTDSMPAKPARKPSRTGLYEEGNWPKYMKQHRYEAFEKAIAASVGSKRLKRFRALTAAQKRALIEQTDIAQIVFNWIESPTGRIRSSFGQDRTAHANAARSFEGFLRLAKQLA
nr:MAG TPA: hypothetical protein [Caudoviricetes sp.]